MYRCYYCIVITSIFMMINTIYFKLTSLDSTRRDLIALVSALKRSPYGVDDHMNVTILTEKKQRQRAGSDNLR